MLNRKAIAAVAAITLVLAVSTSGVCQTTTAIDFSTASDQQQLECARLFFNDADMHTSSSHEDIDTCIELYSKSLARHDSQAHALESSGNTLGALEVRKRSKSIRERLGFAYHNRAVMKGRSRGALADFDKSIELMPEPFSLHHRATLKTALGLYGSAISDWTKAIELNPKSAWAYIMRGRILQFVHDFRGAIQDYDRATFLCKQFGPSVELANVVFNVDLENVVLRERGSLLWQLGQHGQAIQDLETTHTLDQRSLLTSRTLGSMYADVGKLPEAIALYNQALKQHPDDCKSHLLRAQAKWMMREPLEALRDFGKSLSLNPMVVGLCLLDRSNTRSMIGESSWIEDLNRKNCILDPWLLADFWQSASEESSSDKHRQLGLMAHDKWSKGDVSGAIDAWTEEIMLCPQYPKPYYYRAMDRMKIDREGALQDLNQAVRLQPKSIRFLEMRSFLRWQLRDYLGSMSDNLQVMRLRFVATLNRLDDHPICHPAVLWLKIVFCSGPVLMEAG